MSDAFARNKLSEAISQTIPKPRPPKFKRSWVITSERKEKLRLIDIPSGKGFYQHIWNTSW